MPAVISSAATKSQSQPSSSVYLENAVTEVSLYQAQ